VEPGVVEIYELDVEFAWSGVERTQRATDQMRPVGWEGIEERIEETYLTNRSVRTFLMITDWFCVFKHESNVNGKRMSHERKNSPNSPGRLI
jgi:hypothetical protein